jgi:hypothetical protein
MPWVTNQGGVFGPKIDVAPYQHVQVVVAEGT